MIARNRGTDPTDPPSGEEAGPVGVFPSWAWVYGTVLVYGALTILVLWLLSRALDPGS
jgi:hypothetical protein